MLKSRLVLPMLAAGVLVSGARLHPEARAIQEIPAERVAAREWFRDAKFGMFVHWGVYSQLGQGEWVMQNRSLPIGTYEWLASAFNPIKFDAREWVALAKAAGARYITITSRHHDGFSMAPRGRVKRRRAGGARSRRSQHATPHRRSTAGASRTRRCPRPGP